MDYYRSCPLFGGVYSRDNLPALQNKFYIINLDGRKGNGTHWVVVFNCYKKCVYFDSFGVGPPEEVRRRMKATGKQMVMNTYRLQALNSINCGFFCIHIVDNLLKKRDFIDILSDFDPKSFSKNDARFSHTE